ncbi:uncharacterized protein LOC116416891 [Nasonia vitripennis]|uniref:Uncharacterized protein n=1 Tax=Nasonia vitripennis TaxID=7425 RepID=A0A7M7QAJ0_NASVI|nr:uncharacterized protein LOC116416891 [Nasonia vitripennis]
MANVRGPRPSVRRLLMATTNSILLYGAEVWAEAMEVKKYRKQITAVQRRGALRVACSYRTVSGEVVMIIAGVIPVDLLAIKRKRIYERRNEANKVTIATEERDRTMRKWQERWNECHQAKWTKTMI